jgi:hypothetical protein
MELDISKMLTPTKAPFFGIIPGNTVTPIGLATLLITFGTKQNYRTEYIKFEVANFESSYHAILGRPALAKFMAISPLRLPASQDAGQDRGTHLPRQLKEVVQLHQEAIEYVSTTRMPGPSSEVFAVAQQLSSRR